MLASALTRRCAGWAPVPACWSARSAGAAAPAAGTALPPPHLPSRHAHAPCSGPAARSQAPHACRPCRPLRAAAAGSSGAGGGDDGDAASAAGAAGGPAGPAPEAVAPSPAADAAATTAAAAASDGEEEDVLGLGDGEGFEEGAWSPEYVVQLAARQEAAEAAARSEELVRGLLDDPQDLYYYMDRQWAEGPRYVTSQWGDDDGQQRMAFPPAVANDMVGIGTWRLRGELDPVLQFLVARIEGTWRELMDTDLNLYPVDGWKARGWDLVDSEDPARELDGFSAFDIPDPDKGARGYPRLLLENRVYCSRVFRKLHVEVGLRQDGLQVLHVVAYPRWSYDLPIFGLDVVVVNGRATLAVADLCPLSPDLKLPQHFMQTMASLQRTFLAGVDAGGRRIPDWGAAIFSPLAVCFTPSQPDDLAAFVKYGVALHRAYVTIADRLQPLAAPPGDARAAARLAALAAGQRRFCEQQLSNKKTRRVLEAALGAELADAYMRELMFDCDPTYEPPYFDASYERLYTYFQENPDLGEMAEEAAALEEEAEASRASEALGALAEGQHVSRQKLDMAMNFLYQSDPNFRAAVTALTGAEELEPGSVLSTELLALLAGATPAEIQR